MAQYWIESKDGSIHYNYDNYQSIISNINQNQIAIDTIEYIVAEGDKIDFTIFNVELFLSIKCKIVNSSIDECKIKRKLANRIGLFSHFVFENCTIENLDIEAANIFGITIQNCNINKLELANCHNTKELLIINIEKDTKNEIKDLKITDSSFNNINLINADFNIVEVHNTKVNSLLSNGSINRATIKDCEFGEFKLILHWIGQMFLYSTQIINTLYLSRINRFQDGELAFIRFQDCILEPEQILIDRCTIKLRFQNINFKTRKSFYVKSCKKSRLFFTLCQFESVTNFLGSIPVIGGYISIRECTFFSMVQFEASFSEYLIFRNSIFQKNVIIPIYEHFLRYSLDNKIRDLFLRIKFLLTGKRKKDGYLVINCKSPKYIHSSVWCTLKNQALAKNDNVNASKYRKNEMISYYRETWQSKSNFGEKILLLFNRVSNNHGYSWIRGLLFTLSVWLIFFSLFTVSIDNFSFINSSKWHLLIFERSYWTNAFDFLWLPQGLKSLTDKLNINDLNKANYFIMAVSFILGKILIAYGIYQTVSAFRKHGKPS